MARTRLAFDEFLREQTGCKNVYFQPPNGMKMQYPAICYSRNRINNDFADNKVYSQRFEYTVTVIDSNPDSELVSKVSQIPTARYDRPYTADNLNHDVFTITY